MLAPFVCAEELQEAAGGALVFYTFFQYVLALLLRFR